MLKAEILGFRVASCVVRRKATEWLSMLQDDDFYDFLPQLVQVSMVCVCVGVRYRKNVISCLGVSV